MSFHGTKRLKSASSTVSVGLGGVSLLYRSWPLETHERRGVISTSRHRAVVSEARRSSSSSLRIKARSSKYWSKARSRHRLGTFPAPFGFSDLLVVVSGSRPTAVAVRYHVVTDVYHFKSPSGYLLFSLSCFFYGVLVSFDACILVPFC